MYNQVIYDQDLQENDLKRLLERVRNNGTRKRR